MCFQKRDGDTAIRLRDAKFEEERRKIDERTAGIILLQQNIYSDIQSILMLLPNVGGHNGVEKHSHTQ